MGYKLIVFSTPTVEDAKRIARLLLANKLVAEVNIIPNTLIFEEIEGVIDERSEVVVVGFTTDDKLQEATKLIHTRHGMDIPKIFLLEVVGGSKLYLEKIRSKFRVSEESEDIDWEHYGLTTEESQLEEGEYSGGDK